MKTKAAVFSTLLVLGSCLFAQAGPRVAIAVNSGRASCGPIAPVCRPVIFRTFPTWYASPTTSFYSWGPSVTVASSGSGFTTVSPLMNFTGGTPVYRVSPPVLPAQPLIVHPDGAFRWRN